MTKTYISSLLMADETDGARELFRGRRDGSRDSGYEFWTPEKNYALQYGDDLDSGWLESENTILDIAAAVDDDGCVSGESLDGLISGLGQAFGLDADEEVKHGALWDVGATDMLKVVEILQRAGYDGFRWIEDDYHEAYLLVGND